MTLVSDLHITTMCMDLVELLAYVHPGLTTGWEICRFQGQKEITLHNGAPINHPTVIYSVSRCEAFPPAKFLVTGTEEKCDFCRQYAAGSHQVINVDQY